MITTACANGGHANAPAGHPWGPCSGTLTNDNVSPCTCECHVRPSPSIDDRICAGRPNTPRQRADLSAPFPTDPTSYETLNALVGQLAAERSWCPFCIAPAEACGFDKADCQGGEPLSTAAALNRLGATPAMIRKALADG